MIWVILGLISYPIIGYLILLITVWFFKSVPDRDEITMYIICWPLIIVLLILYYPAKLMLFIQYLGLKFLYKVSGEEHNMSSFKDYWRTF